MHFTGILKLALCVFLLFGIIQRSARIINKSAKIGRMWKDQRILILYADRNGIKQIRIQHSQIKHLQIISFDLYILLEKRVRFVIKIYIIIPYQLMWCASFIWITSIQISENVHIITFENGKIYIWMEVFFSKICKYIQW